jgi:hypothetical protein
MKRFAQVLQTEATPGSRGVGLFLASGIFLIIWGLGFVVAGISRI